MKTTTKPQPDVPCPRCYATGKAPWKHPDGGVSLIRCGLCHGSGACDPKRAASEAAWMNENPNPKDQR